MFGCLNINVGDGDGLESNLYIKPADRRFPPGQSWGPWKIPAPADLRGHWPLSTPPTLVQAPGNDLTRIEGLGKWLHIFLLLFGFCFWLHWVSVVAGAFLWLRHVGAALQLYWRASHCAWSLLWSMEFQAQGLGTNGLRLSS